MKQLRDILSDLVERRLWPVALALVVALVAVPIVLGRGGASVPPATPATGATADADTGSTAGTAEKAEVTLDTTEPAEHETADTVRSPFKAPTIKITKTTSADTTPAEPASTSSASTSGGATAVTPVATGAGSTSSGATTTTTDTTSSSGSDTTTTPTTSKPKTTTGVAEDAKDTYHVSVRFGLDGGELTTTRDVARLSPLPSATDPFFVYLGVLETTATKKEKRAVFVVTSDAAPNGEGACHPTKNDCESVELTVGQTVYFDYTDATGKVSQYELQLAGIHKTEIKSEAKASAAIARHSVAGTELLRDAATRNVRFAAGARAYRYLPAAGLLQRAKRKHITAKAAAAGAIPGIELVDAKDQPGLPVWRSPKKHK